MKFKDTFILQRVYFRDPKNKRSGMGYIRQKFGDDIEVMMEKKFTGFFRGYPTAIVGRHPIATTAKHLEPRGRVVSFFDSHGLKPIYQPWPLK